MGGYSPDPRMRMVLGSGGGVERNTLHYRRYYSDPEGNCLKFLLRRDPRSGSWINKH